MVHYTDELHIVPVPKERFLFRVTKEITALWTNDEDSSTVVIQVPRNFITDFASVPRILWNILPPHDGLYRLPAVFHDRLYETQQLLRFEADLFFLDAMRDNEVSFAKRYLMYCGVRIGGECRYNYGPVRQRQRSVVARRFK